MTILNSLKKERDALLTESVNFERTKKYDEKKARALVSEVFWKADYAKEEYRKRHGFIMSIDDVISEVKNEMGEGESEVVGEEEFDVAEDEVTVFPNECKYCGAKLPEGASFCGKCGRQQ